MAAFKGAASGYQRETVIPVGTLAGFAIEATATRRTTGVELTLRCEGVPHTMVELAVETLHDDSKAVGLVDTAGAPHQRSGPPSRRARRRDHPHRTGMSRALGPDRGRSSRRPGELSPAKLRAADIEARLTDAATYKPPAVVEQNDDPDL